MYFFFFKQKTAYEMLRSLVGSEMCIRDRYQVVESGVYLCDTPRPNCNDLVFSAMYEPEAIILATCYPIGGMTLGQWIIKLMPNTPSTPQTPNLSFEMQ